MQGASPSLTRPRAPCSYNNEVAAFTKKYGVTPAQFKKVAKETSKAAEAAGVGKGKRKKKDPNAPKKPCSAYLYFCSENRPKAKKALPSDAKMTDVAKHLAIMWGKVKAADKNRFEKMAAKDKARFQKEKAAYDAKN